MRSIINSAWPEKPRGSAKDNEGRPALQAAPGTYLSDLDLSARAWAAGDRRTRSRTILAFACRQHLARSTATLRIKRHAYDLGLEVREARQ